MLYIFDSNEALLCVLSNISQKIASKSLQYDSGLLYDSGLYYKILWTAEETCPYFDAVHTEGLDGTNIFTFSVPANHPDALHVVEGNLVAFRDVDSNYQLFEINHVTDKHDANIIRTAECENIAISELIDIYIDDMRPTGKTALEALTQVLTGTRWQAGIVDDLGLNSTDYYHTNALAAINKIAEVWKGEIRFRITVSGSAINARYVDILARRGTETGKRFAYSKDIESITRVIDLSNVKTALYGYGKGEETADGFGRRIDFADVVWSTPTNPANKPLGQKWVGDEDARLAWGHPDGAGGKLHRFGVNTDAEETIAATLLQKTWDALQKVKEPLVNYSMGVIDLETLAGLAHEAVRLGDTVAVIDSVLAPELRTTARVIKIARNLTEPEKTNIELGNFLPNMSETANKLANVGSTLNFRQGIWDDKYDAISGVPTSVLTGVIDALRNEIQSVNGYVRITDADGIIIYDTPDPATATKALRLKGGIFAITNSKTAGNWNWTTFGTGDGFVADRITSGTISADRIAAGSITGVKIAANTITGTNIAAASITGACIAAGTITATQIAAGTITGACIAAGTITADKLSASNLSAITANLGTVYVGGANNGNGVITVEDANSNALVTINNNGINVNNATRSTSLILSNSYGVGYIYQMPTYNDLRLENNSSINFINADTGDSSFGVDMQTGRAAIRYNNYPLLPMLNYGNAIVGSPPAVSAGLFYYQTGTSVATTSGGGDITINFPTAFPSGVVSVVATYGDVVQGNVGLAVWGVSLSSFNVRCWVSGVGLRVNWIAIGW